MGRGPGTMGPGGGVGEAGEGSWGEQGRSLVRKFNHGFKYFDIQHGKRMYICLLNSVYICTKLSII